MPSGKKEAIEKRVLEAEKVVVSNILYNWKRRFGMDYVIVVRNGPGDMFSRVSVSKKDSAPEEIKAALERAKTRL